MSWQEVADIDFRTSWEKVFRSVEPWIVGWGPSAPGPGGCDRDWRDEILWRRAHKYLTVVYQIDRHSKRLLWVGRDPRSKRCCASSSNSESSNAAELKSVCPGDMWKPYLKVITKASTALHVRIFHIAMHMNPRPSMRFEPRNPGI